MRTGEGEPLWAKDGALGGAGPAGLGSDSWAPEGSTQPGGLRSAAPADEHSASQWLPCHCGPSILSPRCGGTPPIKLSSHPGSLTCLNITSVNRVVAA